MVNGGWTDEKDQFIRENYPEWSDEEFAEKFGTTASAVGRHRSDIGVTNRWTEEEEEFIRDNYLAMSDNELADELNRSLDSIRNHRNKKMGLTRPESHYGKFNQGIHWTDEKEHFLKENYESMKYQEIADKFNTSYQAVLDKAFELDLIKQNMWSEDEIKYVRQNWRNMGDQELAENLDRGVESLRNLRSRLDIVRPGSHISRFRKGFHWSEEDEEFLKKNFDSMKYQKIADELGISYQAVMDKANRLGLEKISQWSEDEEEFLRNNWKNLSDHQLAEKLDRSLTGVMQKRSKKLDLVREDPTGNEYIWRRWEETCVEIAGLWFESVKSQYVFENGLRADIYLPDQETVIEVKWCYYIDWNPEKYLEMDKVSDVVVWSYHKCPPNSCNIPILNRYEIVDKLDDEDLINEVRTLKSEKSNYQTRLNQSRN